MAFSTAEDTLIAKLLWYRLGNEVSERQWRDVLGILRIDGGDLDQGYLDLWAASLGVADLLGRARAEMKMGGQPRPGTGPTSAG